VLFRRVEAHTEIDTLCRLDGLRDVVRIEKLAHENLSAHLPKIRSAFILGTYENPDAQSALQQDLNNAAADGTRLAARAGHQDACQSLMSHSGCFRKRCNQAR
jgi:hypothetical protein